MEEKKIKLSPAMKDVILKMRDGYMINAEGRNQTNYYLEKDKDVKKMNWNTAYFMKRRGLINLDRTEKGFWGLKYIHTLTDLGKTITI